jgi:acyl-CoA synthetase (AMP-forming)/AMP-acid ligase II
MFSTLIDLLRARALHQPERLGYTFLVDGEDEELSISYGRLDESARRIGALLQSLGAEGERVLLLYPPGLDYVKAFFGCLYAGAVAVPAYPPRMNRNLARLQSVVADAQATFALTVTPLLSKLKPLLAAAPDLKAVRWLATDTDSARVAAHQWRGPARGRVALGGA